MFPPEPEGNQPLVEKSSHEILYEYKTNNWTLTYKKVMYLSICMYTLE